MGRRIRGLAVSLVGLGIGMGGGAEFGSAAVAWAVVVGLVGIALSFVGSREPALAAGSQSQPSIRRPQLAGLGSRVEQILRLAEEQADNYRKEAEREAESLVTAARLEAGAIIDTARTKAARFGEVPESGAGDR